MSDRRIATCVVVATLLLVAVTLSIVPMRTRRSALVDRYPGGCGVPPDRILVFCDCLFSTAVKTEQDGWLICPDYVWMNYTPGCTATVVEKGTWILQTRSVK